MHLDPTPRVSALGRALPASYLDPVALMAALRDR